MRPLAAIAKTIDTINPKAVMRAMVSDPQHGPAPATPPIGKVQEPLEQGFVWVPLRGGCN
jgi:hypothetical protein